MNSTLGMDSDLFGSTQQDSFAQSSTTDILDEDMSSIEQEDIRNSVESILLKKSVYWQ